METGAVRNTLAAQPERYRVCLVVGQLALGGLERQAFLLATGLDRSAFDVTVVSLSAQGAWAEPLVRAGVRLVQIPGRGPGGILRLVRMIGVLRRLRPHLVYSFQHAPSAYARIAGLAAGVPALVTGERATWLTSGMVLLEMLLNRFTECVICNADSVRREVLARARVPARKAVTIRNAVELPPARDRRDREAARRTLGFPEEGCLVGTIARLDPLKNLPLLIEAAGLSKAEGSPIRFGVIGTGPLQAALAREIETRGLRDVVRLLGERPAARDLLPAFDIFALTSLSEGLPNTVLEAMAAGLPCVCTDVGGCREVVLDGLTGYLVPSGDARALSARLRELAGDPLLRGRMGAAGRERAGREFSLEAMVARTETVFRALLAEPAAPRRGRRLAAGTADRLLERPGRGGRG